MDRIMVIWCRKHEKKTHGWALLFCLDKVQIIRQSPQMPWKCISLTWQQEITHLISSSIHSTSSSKRLTRPGLSSGEKTKQNIFIEYCVFKRFRTPTEHIFSVTITMFEFQAKSFIVIPGIWNVVGGMMGILSYNILMYWYIIMI